LNTIPAGFGQWADQEPDGLNADQVVTGIAPRMLMLSSAGQQLVVVELTAVNKADC